MDETAKYLIHAKLTADGVVERSDVVGAVFGQTEGLLGDNLDLRDLQQSSRVGRIDVQVESEGGQSFGEITIATSLDRVETSILAASLETISRVGPCQARVEVTDIEDVRAAKRRIVVQRAKELLAESFEESIMTSQEILEEVRESARVEDINEYEGLPAGPNVAESDAIVVVEGRADVLQLLKYGIKNAVAVEGTNVPDTVADLTAERTVTAFLDGDRGGELILRELAQVGDVDFVAFAPEGRSVEDLSRSEVLAALREKTAYEVYEEARAEASPASARAIAATDGSSQPAPEDEPHPRTESPTTTESAAAPYPEIPDDSLDAAAVESAEAPPEVESEPTSETESSDTAEPAAGTGPAGSDAGNASNGVEPASNGADPTAASTGSQSAGAVVTETQEREPASLADHVREVVGGDTGRARLLDDDFALLAEVDADGVFDALESADEVPFALVLDGDLSQRTLDVAAQRGVEQVVARGTGEFVKQPVSPRVRNADGFLD